MASSIRGSCLDETQQRVERWAISVRGIVQGVGFRPFIYALAKQHGVVGSVNNDAQGVLIEAEAPRERLDLFLRAVRDNAPPLAVIDAMSWKLLDPRGDREFRIEESTAGGAKLALISPDMATCDQCLVELFDPSDRRYRYPFINCTNCGPRFTITRSVPYDRAETSMASFTMCPRCQGEYDNPGNRRFHAQPNACPVCGPQVRLVDRQGLEVKPGRLPPGIECGDPIACCAQLLCSGAILTVKGLGGYHLACDPFNREAVATLRQKKTRQDKPFALMAPNLEEAARLCYVGGEDARWLAGPTRPVVLLRRRERNPIGEWDVVDEVAPRQKTLGIMLAYTPLHHVLLRDVGYPLIMTSGNRADEPIAYRDDEAFEMLGDIADYFLVHDRPIHTRCDDSVVRITTSDIYPIRRSRGFAPAPLNVHPFGRHVLACGGELKNTFCLAKGRHAFISHHIGDLENYETLRSFQEGVNLYCGLFDVHPELVVYDLHPEYLSTKYAQEQAEEGLPAIGIQHHHAHIASCLADNQRPPGESVIGVALDGTGYGTDGAVWGGEFLIGSIEKGFVRSAHLEYVQLPGGKAAIRQPWRMALAHLLTQYSEDEVLDFPLEMVRQVGEHQVRLVGQILRAGSGAAWISPRTSSAGRLFDAVAALCGLPGSRQTTYEGQAAVELELAAGPPASCGYPFHIRDDAEMWIIETGEIIASIVADLLSGREVADISSAFHRTVADLVVACCLRLRGKAGAPAVALSGGTFQNTLLLEQTTSLLEERGFMVYRHRRAPANDGGLSLGQAVLGDSLFSQEMVREVGTLCV